MGVMSEPLPTVLPSSPLPLVSHWLAEAERTVRTASTMALATTDPDGRPSARMVICRGFDAGAGWLVFYSDRPSRKGRALAVHPRAAIVFHWEALQRQIRIEGPVTEAPVRPDRRLLAEPAAGRAHRGHRQRPERAHRQPRRAPGEGRRGGRAGRRESAAPRALDRLPRLGRACGAVGEPARAHPRPRGVDARPLGRRPVASPEARGRRRGFSPEQRLALHVHVRSHRAEPNRAIWKASPFLRE